MVFDFYICIFYVFIWNWRIILFYFYICICIYYKENKLLYNNVVDNFIVLVEIWKSLIIFWFGICGNVG